MRDPVVLLDHLQRADLATILAGDPLHTPAGAPNPVLDFARRGGPIAVMVHRVLDLEAELAEARAKADASFYRANALARQLADRNDDVTTARAEAAKVHAAARDTVREAHRDLYRIMGLLSNEPPDDLVEAVQYVLNTRDRVAREAKQAREALARVGAMHFPYRPAHVEVYTCGGCNVGMELVLWPCKHHQAITGAEVVEGV